MKLGFICLNLPGHLNPMTALARQLQVLTFSVVAASPFGSARTARILLRALELSTLKSRRFLFRLPELLSRRRQSS